ncbi:hypothetical protein GLAREA_04866 [Glarea lozoyensis ATCC 20868]|uniref:Uncharacterized protein n=1 Tax=Glarea lozoyensis (strain ATCC 20868 / MF5171) TaxID=1116229 RepID=S3CQW9_GLAL2|nr:uncharacterized protein GLAREA_04866 [Glarea lozoyensis ATCC 20868]EPE28075.1 hypothetical protein GLAREA_04866 [Glarea lozoyensis ATCC 20868]
MILDTGYEGHGLITYQVVRDILDMRHAVTEYDDAKSHDEESTNKSACVCLNGEELRAIGKITLRWKGRAFRKVIITTFLVIPGENLLWQIVLGSPVIRDNGILVTAGFGGMLPVPQKKTAEERAKDKQRRKEHEDEVAANNANVIAHKKEKEKQKQKDARNATDTNSSGSKSRG